MMSRMFVMPVVIAIPAIVRSVMPVGWRIRQMCLSRLFISMTVVVMMMFHGQIISWCL